MLETLVLGALSQLMTERAILRAVSFALGKPEERALRAAVDRAVQRVIAELEEPAAGRLNSVLGEHLSEPPRLPIDAETSVIAALSAAVDALVTRLAEPSGMSGERSYLDEISVDPRWLADRLTAALVGAIKQVALTENALAQLATQLNFDEIQRSQRSSRESAPLPFMVPRLPADFVERPIPGAELVAALLAAADRPDQAGPVVVTGAGGFGKTRLASWACRQAEVRDRFPDGVLWVELGQRPSMERLVVTLADLTARLTGGHRSAYRTVPVAADAFAAALGARRILLVVDDVWQAPDIEPFSSGGPCCVRLVTTRRPPAVSGREIRVNAMSASEATALLRCRLPEATSGDLAPLLERSGCWPLALASLVGILRSLHERQGLSVAEAVGGLVAELDRRGVGVLDDLTDVGGGRGIAATLALSLDELRDSAPASFGRYVSLAAFGAGGPVPSRLLGRLWGLNEVQMRAEWDRFLDRSLVISAGADGLRVHDVICDELRRRFPERVSPTSQALLDACRPPGGWHTLRRHDELWPQLAYHLIQAGRGAELGELLRDLRFLVTRLHAGGPLAVESDLRAYQTTCPRDAYAGLLATILRQEAHLLTGHQSVADLALTLHGRLFSRPDVFTEIRHIDEALPERGLVAAQSLPDRADPRLIRVLTGHRRGVGSLAWMPDGRLASVGAVDDTLRMWDTNTGEQESVVPIPVTHLAARFSPDGRHLAVIGSELETGALKRGIQVIEVTTGAALAGRPGVPDRALGMCWGPDSATLAIIHPKTVELWQPFSGGASRMLAAEQDGMVATDVAWHPRAGLACMTINGWLVGWPDPESGRIEDVWKLDLGLSKYGPSMLAWRPDGRLLSVATGYEFLIVEPGRQRVVQRTSTYCSYEHAWRPDGTALTVSGLIGASTCISTWHQPRKTIPGSDDAPYTPEGGAHLVLRDLGGRMAWHPAGEYVAVATASPEIEIWRPAAPAGPVTRPGDLWRVAWQPAGERLAVRDRQGVAGFVNSAEPHAVTWTTSRKPQYSRLPDAVWSPDGRFLADDSHDRIKIKNAETGAVLRELPARSDDLKTYILAWPAPRSLMTETHGAVALVDAEDGHEQASVRIDHPDGPASNLLAISADGSRLAVLADHVGLTIIEMLSGMRGPLDCGAPNLRDVAFLPDTAHLLTSDHSGLALWDVAGKNFVAETVWREPCGVAADPTGTYVAAVRVSGEIALFEARTLNRVCQLSVDGTVQWCAFDSAGERLAVAGSAGLYLFRIRHGSRAQGSGRVIR